MNAPELPGAVEPPSPAGHADPPDEAPWAMPIVVRVEKGAEPDATAVAEACASAVVRLLDDDRCGPDGEWHEPVTRWLDGRIRKVARRARGARWTSAIVLPGITVEHAGALVRAFVPTPTDAVPPEIAKLQVSGLELSPGPSTAGPHALPIALTPNAGMSALKAAVQVAHAAQLTRDAMPTRRLRDWREAGFEVRLVRPDAAEWARLVRHARVIVRDAGFTEIAPGTRTAVALW